MSAVSWKSTQVRRIGQCCKFGENSFSINLSNYLLEENLQEYKNSKNMTFLENYQNYE